MKKRFPELNVNQCDQDVVRTTRPGHKQRPPWPESCCPGHRHLAGALVAMPSPGFFQVAWKSLCPIGVFTWDGDTVTQLDPFPWEVQTEDVLCPEQGRVCYVSLGARPQRTVLRRNLASQLPGSSRTSPLPCKSSPTQAFHVLQPSRSTLCFGVPVAPAGAPPPPFPVAVGSPRLSEKHPEHFRAPIPTRWSGHSYQLVMLLSSHLAGIKQTGARN